MREKTGRLEEFLIRRERVNEGKMGKKFSFQSASTPLASSSLVGREREMERKRKKNESSPG